MTPGDPGSPIPPDQVPVTESPEPPQIYLSPQELENLSVPEDIRTSWGWLELGLFAVFAIFSFVLIFLGASVYLIEHYHMDPQQLQDFFSASAPYTVSVEVIWSLCLLAFLVLMIRIYHGQRFWHSIGWRKLRLANSGLLTTILLCVLGGAILAVVVGFLSSFVQTNAHLPMQDLFDSRSNVLWLMGYGILFAPFWEETMFRGFLYPVFARKWGVPMGILVTGLLFGAMHAAQLWGGWGQIALLTFVGIVLTWARARSGTVVASFLIHITYNTILFVVFYAGTQGFHHLPPAH